MVNTIRKQTFFKNIYSLMISQVIVKILGLFYRLYLTNRNGFGDEGNAIANAGFQVFALFLSIIAIGIPSAISKLVAENVGKGNYNRAYKVFKIALIIFATLGLIGSFILYYYADILAKNYLHMKEAKLSIIALCPSVFLVSIISVLKGFFGGIQSINMTANAQSLDQLIKTISTIVMMECLMRILGINNIELMSACSNFATTLGNIGEVIYLYLAYRKVLPQIKIEILYNKRDKNIRIIKVIKQIMSVAVPMTLIALITTISKNIDSVTIIKILKDLIGYEEAKKQYGILSGKIEALVNFPLSFNMAIVATLLPSIASNSKNNNTIIKRIKQSFLLGTSIAIPITIFYFIFSDMILKLLFPNASDGGILLKISSLQIIFITIEQISSTILNGIGKNIVPIIAISIGVITKGIFNLLLVPRVENWYGGASGASIATVICHVVACIILIFCLRANLKAKYQIENNDFHIK